MARSHVPVTEFQAGSTEPVAGVTARQWIDTAIQQISRVLYGSHDVVRLTLMSALCRGHVLLEDVPGVGKTTLARAVARVLGCSFARVQFTADMLPSDVLGVQILDPQRGELVFKRGPIFTNVVLADEINRASPRTQSAMLEAMGEGLVTIDDATHPLPAPFLVLATQNPVEHHGAYPLPESQLDRFMIRVSLGYPTADEERELLQRTVKPYDDVNHLETVFSPVRLLAVQRLIADVTLGEACAAYMVQLVHTTRNHPELQLGCSPRGALAFAAMARAHAFFEGRTFVTPDDIKRVAPAVLAHRLLGSSFAPSASNRDNALMLVTTIINSTSVPR